MDRNPSRVRNKSVWHIKNHKKTRRGGDKWAGNGGGKVRVRGQGWSKGKEAGIPFFLAVAWVGVGDKGVRCGGVTSIM